jgi:hypothetical protein
MSSPSYVKYILTNPERIEDMKVKFPYMTRVVLKCLLEEYPSWFKRIKDNICPFCGKQFINRYALRLHLARTSCEKMYERLVNRIIDKWNRFDFLCERAKHTKKNEIKQKLLKMLDDENITFEEIYRFCKEV